jgi:hypothetical protein
MVVLKKCYEKDEIKLAEFLAKVRKLAGKQFRCQIKRNKVVQVLKQGA